MHIVMREEAAFRRLVGNVVSCMAVCLAQKSNGQLGRAIADCAGTFLHRGTGPGEAHACRAVTLVSGGDADAERATRADRQE